MAWNKNPKRALAFTKQGIAKLPIPGGPREYWHDTHTRGLCVCLAPSGSRTFYLYKSVEGRPEKIRLGTFPDLSVEQARELAKRIIGDIASGKDPMEERRKARQVPTVKDAFEVWLNAYAKARLRSWRTEQGRFNLHLRRFAHRRLNTIRTAEVAMWHNELAHGGPPATANRCLQLLRTIYRKAPSLLGYHGPNPCEGIKRFHEEARDRFLQRDELPRFFAALADEPELYRDYFSVLLFTGARKSNVEGMRWEDLNLDARLWRIPSEAMKTGQVVVVPLVQQVVDILVRRYAASNGNPWVFAIAKGKKGHLTSPMYHWRALLKRAGLTNLRPHDLRRTLGSWQAIGGASLPVIGKSLGHSSVASTLIYARLSTDPVRESVEKATTLMLAAANSEQREDTRHGQEGQDSGAGG